MKWGPSFYQFDRLSFVRENMGLAQEHTRRDDAITNDCP